MSFWSRNKLVPFPYFLLRSETRCCYLLVGYMAVRAPAVLKLSSHEILEGHREIILATANCRFFPSANPSAADEDTLLNRHSSQITFSYDNYVRKLCVRLASPKCWPRGKQTDVQVIVNRFTRLKLFWQRTSSVFQRSLNDESPIFAMTFFDWVGFAHLRIQNLARWLGDACITKSRQPIIHCCLRILNKYKFPQFSPWCGDFVLKSLVRQCTTLHRFQQTAISVSVNKNEVSPNWVQWELPEKR